MMMLRRRADPKTSCEPAQSKCAWTFHRSHFVQKIAGQMSRTKTATQTLSELAQSWTCHQSHSMRQFHKSHFRENLLVKCHGPKPRRSFGRACAIEMHMDMPPEPSHAAIYRENAAPQDRVARFARVCAVEMHLDISQEPLCARIYRKNARAKSATHTLCEPAQLKCAWTFHKSHFTRKFRGKMPGPRWGTLIKHRPLHLP